MSTPIEWNERYRDGNLPWDTGQPSSELQRVIAERVITPCRALDIGCGTGTNSVWLAQHGFDVTGLDVAPLAIKQATERARAARVPAKFLASDVLNLPDLNVSDLGEPFGFFFDRGCYHAVRRDAPNAYAPAIARLLAPGARGLVLAGNAREPHDPGPPVVTEDEIRSELGQDFQILDLHEFRFDEAPGAPVQFLGWSCLVEKF